jgi:hypothetical protein
LIAMIALRHLPLSVQHQRALPAAALTPAAVLAQDSAGEEDDPPSPVAPAPVSGLPRDQRRDSAGEMLASAAAAANTYRRPSAAESLSAARQLVSWRRPPTCKYCIKMHLFDLASMFML